MKLNQAILLISLFFISTGILISCGIGTSSSSLNSDDELGQQVGDSLSSIDEMGGSGGSFSNYILNPKFIEKHFGTQDRLLDYLIPPVFAATCRESASFSSCSNNQITRTFDECTIGSATFNGEIVLSFDDAATDDTCRMTTNGHSISRNPDFSITGRFGGTFTVNKTGTVGQQITKTAQGFEFTNDGIRRRFTNAEDEVVFDFTTQTTAAIGITGANRANRVLDGGTLRVTNNKTDVTCDLTPENVTYESGCNCAVSGEWTGTCSNDDEVSIEITGCGTASLTKGASSRSVEFDRCYSVN